jgi:hypothetical protein
MRGFRVKSDDIMSMVDVVFGDNDSLTSSQFREAMAKSEDVQRLLGFF